MDDESSLLQIEALGTVIGRNQHLAILLELANHGVIGAAVVGQSAVPARKKILEHLLGFHALGEDNRFLFGSRFLHKGKSLFENGQQLTGLGILGNAFGYGLNLLPLA